ncbi:MAG: hypothetical protein COT92_02270, partial [Candidatus Doudnabacteria bacterium CG10_big_fil_rev_8_21_14_0_10_42_18]
NTNAGTASTSLYKLNWQVNGNLTVASGGSIDVDYRGYTEDQGPGTSLIDTDRAGGGSYGGRGANGDYSDSGPVYGSLTNPTDLGSGGGGGTSGVGGPGGGAIIFNVTGTTSLIGLITADGKNGASCWSPGGGSGGSINLTTGTLSGSGSITTNGGTGCNLGGSGGGGRIAVNYTTDSSSITYQSHGSTNGYLGVETYSSAGTIYKKSAAQNFGDLILENNNLAGSDERIIPATPLGLISTDPLEFDSITATSSARFYLASSTASSLSASTTSLTLSGNGMYDAIATSTLTYGSLTWNSTGIILDTGGTFPILSQNQDLIIPASSRLIFNVATSSLNTTRTYNNLTVNGTLSHAYNTNAGTASTSLYKLNWQVNGNLTVASGGSINVNDRGYPMSEGPGSPADDTDPAGGSYGGLGGNGFVGTASSTYGSSTNPTHLGSGGGDDTNTALNTGGSGGGAIILNVTGTSTISGIITANGQSQPAGWDGTGGSGGSVNITTGGLEGSGLLYANGGDATQDGGAGGGGRIAVIYSVDISSITLTAAGGTGGENPGAIGTTYYVLGNSSPDAPSSLGGASLVDGSWTTDTTPTLSFTLSDSDGADTVLYNILIDDSSNFSSPVVNYTSALQAQGSASFTVGQAAGSGSYSVGSVSQTLSDASYYWRVSATDGSGANSATSTANSGSIAFKIDTTDPVPGSISVATTSSASLTVSISGSSDADSGLSAAPYIFYNSTAATNSSATSSTSWLSSSLTPNTQYSFYSQVTDYAGNNTTTSITSVYTLANIPTSVSASADSGTQITVSWSANSNPAATEYFVENTTSGTDSGWVTATSAAFTGLTCETSYDFNVKARNADNFETATTSSATVATGACASPETPSAGGGGGGSNNPPQPLPEQIIELVCPPPANGFFTECIYNNPDFTGLAATSTAFAINYSWGNGSPDIKVEADTFSAKWAGYFDFEDGVYQFIAKADDGVRVYVDGDLIIDSWRNQSATTYTATKHLASGGHFIKMEYYENYGQAVAELFWKKTAGSCMEPGNNQFSACYFNDSNLETPVFTETTNAINYNWGSGSPNSSVPVNNFSAKWEGNFDFEEGNFLFSATADDGVRVYVDGDLIIDSWRNQSATTYSKTRKLSQGKHSVKMEFYENGGQAVAKLDWSRLLPLGLECPEAPQNEFIGCYYNGKNFEFFAATSSDSFINYNWGANSPKPGIVEKDIFSVKWKGSFNFDSADYEFTAKADDGVRVYIDGILVIDQWKDQSAKIYKATRALSQGSHLLKMEYYENYGAAVAELGWEKKPQDRPKYSASLSLGEVTATSVAVMIMPSENFTHPADKPFIYFNVSDSVQSSPTASSSLIFKGLFPESKYVFRGQITDSQGNSYSTEDLTVITLSLHEKQTNFPLSDENSPEIPPTEEEFYSGGTLGQARSPISQIGQGIASAVTSVFHQSELFVGQAGKLLTYAGLTGGKIMSNTKKVVEGIQTKILEDETTTHIATGVSAAAIAPTILAMEYSLSIKGLVLNVSSFSDLWLKFFFLLHGLMTTLGFRRLRRRWGTIYDSKTKQPLDPVIAELVNFDNGKVVEQAISDINGKFGFLDSVGKYVIRVKKTHYQFPSKIITGKEDGIFTNLYHGELLVITNGGEVLTPNIPMDPLEFDWNQEGKKKIVNDHPKLEGAIAKILQILFWTGFVFVFLGLIAKPTATNSIFFVIYVVLAVLRSNLPLMHLWGKISNAPEGISLLLELSPQKFPSVVVSRALVNSQGRFFLKAPGGDFVLKIKQITDGNGPNILIKTYNVKVGREGLLRGKYRI